MQDIGSGAALGVSADGSVVVGNTQDHTGIGGTAFLWTAATGRQELLPGSWSLARGVSADGEVVVGVEYSQGVPGFGEAQPFRWTAAGGWVHLDTQRQSWATGVNADGSVIVGYRWSAVSNSYSADRWTASRGVLDLGPLSPGSFAFATNHDGSVVVGGAQYAFQWFSSALGERYCAAEENSTGRGGLLDANGSDLVALDDVRLAAEFLPLGGFAYFLVSRDGADTFPVPGSQGRLCLGGSIGRYVGPGQVQHSGTTGRIELVLDLTATPTPLGPVAAQPGDTWRFQAWFRDTNPGSTSNFTDAIRVTLH